MFPLTGDHAPIDCLRCEGRLSAVIEDPEKLFYVMYQLNKPYMILSQSGTFLITVCYVMYHVNL